MRRSSYFEITDERFDEEPQVAVEAHAMPQRERRRGGGTRGIDVPRRALARRLAGLTLIAVAVALVALIAGAGKRHEPAAQGAAPALPALAPAAPPAPTVRRRGTRRAVPPPERPASAPLAPAPPPPPASVPAAGTAPPAPAVTPATAPVAPPRFSPAAAAGEFSFER